MGRPKGGTNQRRSCDEKARLIEEYYDSGMGYKAFAQEKGIAHSLFYSWLQKYDEGGVKNLRFSRRKPSKADAVNEEIQCLKQIIAEQQIEIYRLKELISDSDFNNER